ncbi:MAG: leucine-rich repeat domain-containing protein, partial [Clostridia bacterium]|nr:leucine-rich repeat domain-containing protein [Clostridia bacterium]
MSNINDFLIQDGILLKYEGTDADVVIPDGIGQIGSWAFTDKTDVKSIVIPEGVTTIMNHAFSGCTQLVAINIPQSVSVIKDGVFYRCSALESVKLPHSNIALGNGIFGGCTQMKRLEIPQGMEKINGDSFRGMDNLETVIIPASVKSITSLAFSRSKHIKEYIVDEANEHYCSVDGVLYNKNMDKILACPQTKEGKFIIPESVKTIGFSAFSNCESITEVVLHNGITEIEAVAFSRCSKLEKIDLPESLTTIGQDAFHECNLIREVYIPASVSAIGESGNDVFGKGVEAITVDPRNKKYTTIDGMLYTMKGKNLQYCPEGKKGEINLPDKLTNINGAAFSGCSMITAVNIPQSVKKIG